MGSVGGFEQFWGPNRIGVFSNVKSVSPLFSPAVVTSELSATSTEYVRFNKAAIMDEALSSDNRTQITIGYWLLMEEGESDTLIGEEMINGDKLGTLDSSSLLHFIGE
ncbi:hypothetical protein KY285_014410 [Solanum tuberosum]|nr:hypothetical protein KY285_014410 [Solanum tuberosum]